MNDFTRMAIASRAFALAAIVGLAVAFGRSSALGPTLVVVAIAAIASYLAYSSAEPTHWVMSVEAALAGLVVVSALPESVVLLPYLVVLPLLAGLARGVFGASLVIVAQLTVIVGGSLASGGLDGQAELLAPWALTIVGAGLLGAWGKKLGKSPAGTRTAEKYDSARRLLSQLRTLASRLPGGLDPVTIADQMLTAVERAAGRESLAAVFTMTDGGLFAPLAYSAADARDAVDHRDAVIRDCWTKASVRARINETGERSEHVVAVPLRLGSEMLGVLVYLSQHMTPPESLEQLQRELDEMSLRLATALAFDEVRDLVTGDERQRLAREIHDGIAQEVASLGYVVDELSERTSEPDVSAGLKDLRQELSRVVGDLRLSIFDLRTDVRDGPGLGSAISDYVRKVGARSSMTVHLTLNEAPTRLSPSVETELFRITQEAVTNARKHSQAENIWVDCRVQPPAASITVRDDGCGVGVGRADSYGLKIMQERADRIGAKVRLTASDERHGSGTCVTISIGQSGTVLRQVEVAS